MKRTRAGGPEYIPPNISDAERELLQEQGRYTRLLWWQKQLGTWALAALIGFAVWASHHGINN